MTWTETAKERLDGYLLGLHHSLRTSGADPSEVTEDIRRHIAEEIRVDRLEVVAAADIDRLLKRIGAPEAPVPDPAGCGDRDAGPDRNHSAGPAARGEGGSSSAPGCSSPSGGPPPRAAASSRRVSLFLFGVVLPLITLLLELLTQMCAATFFDPMPTLWHVPLVALMPVANFLAWNAVVERRADRMRWLLPLNAAALGVGAFYTAIYLPLAPMAVFAILFFGWGFLPLSPLLSLACAWRLRVLLRCVAAEQPNPEAASLQFWRWFAAGLGALLMLAAPPLLTRHWARQAVDGSSSERASATDWLRRLGHESTLLADCYGTRGWEEEGLMRLVPTPRPLRAEQARALYYRVTGRAFNSVPPPQAGHSTRDWSFLDEFSWDADQAGTTVGGRLKGLSMAQSRLDSLLDADAGWSYVEWTMEFKNSFPREREARAQIALPPGGVVSRLTLWVNGEEREAAFAGSGQVRAAYENVVKVQRRDPVLVTSCGPDRVLVQCFPVPANGGTIKVRLGITSPLHLENAGTAVVRWPSLMERNFSLAESARHSLWVEGGQAMTSTLPGLSVDRTKPGKQALHGELRDEELASSASVVRLARSPGVDVSPVWVADPHDPQGRLIRQRAERLKETPPARVVLVIDGSVSMTPFLPQLADAIQRLPDGIEFSLLLADDFVEELTGKPARGDAGLYQRAAAVLRGRRGVGGQDNVPALARAWDLAGELPGSAVVWVHAGQPQLFDNAELLQQRLDWRGDGPSALAPVLYEMQAKPGPDRVLEKFSGSPALRTVPRYGGVGEDLGRLLGNWRADSGSLGWVRDRVAPAAFPEAARGKHSSRHLARLWGFDEVQRLLRARQREQAVQVAGTYQLVTPVSGAVVLENKQQFDQAGLRAVDPQTVPTVPEPGALALLSLVAVALLGWRRWQSRRRPLHSPR